MLFFPLRSFLSNPLKNSTDNGLTVNATPFRKKNELGENWGETFYRGKFSLFIEHCCSVKGCQNPLIEHFQKDAWIFALAKIRAMLELHQVSQCRSAFEDLYSNWSHFLAESPSIFKNNTDAFPSQFISLAFDLINAKILLHEEEHQRASAIIELACQKLSNFHSNREEGSTTFTDYLAKYSYFCHLECGDIALDLGQYHKLSKSLEILEQAEPFQEFDIKLSLLLLRSRYALMALKDARTALSFACKCYGEATQNGWTYFIVRAQILMALCYKSLNETLKYKHTLSLLELSLEGSQHQYLIFLVNHLFKADSVVKTSIEFDKNNKRIFLNGEWLTLHDRPILFEFLNLLHEREEFTTKRNISERLWPHEIYKPRVHDPRIFDIAKRVRDMIEPYRSQPLTLLSGRMGYKLASH